MEIGGKNRNLYKTATADLSDDIPDTILHVGEEDVVVSAILRPIIVRRLWIYIIKVRRRTRPVRRTNQANVMRTRTWAMVFIALGLTTASGCSTAPQRPDPLPPGNYRYVRQYLSWMIRKDMKKYDTQGLSIAIIDGRDTVWSQGFGYMDAADRLPATAETMYPVGSISKVVTAMEVLKLADSGSINIDRPLTTYLHDFSILNRFGRSLPITLRSMLAHHSGLPSDHLRGMWVEHPSSLAQLVMDLRTDSLVNPPQTMYKYSNLDFSLLGRVIEVSTGQNFATAMHRNLLAPLGMTHSLYVQNPSMITACSKGYRQGQETLIPGLRDTPAGGLLSNVVDLGKFMKFIFAEGRIQTVQLVRRATLAESFQVQYPGLPLDFGHEIGLAWMLNGVEVPGVRQVAWHDGEYPPFFGSMLVLPKEKLGVVVLANSQESKGFVGQVAVKALQLAYEAKFAVSPPPLKAPAMPKPVTISGQTLDRLAGLYVILGQESSITRDGQILDVDALGIKLQLIPTGDATFMPEKTFLGLIHIPLWPLSVDFMSVEGRDLALLHGFPAPMAFEKIPRYSIPQAWMARLGDYTNINPDGQLDFNHLTLEAKNGVLVAHARISSRVFHVQDAEAHIALQPISDTEAIVVGVGNAEGGSVRLINKGDENILLYSGYQFAPIKH